MICSPLQALKTRTESSSQDAHAYFSSAFIVYETTPKWADILKAEGVPTHLINLLHEYLEAYFLENSKSCHIDNGNHYNIFSLFLFYF